jgi:hypothetical protein
MNAKLWTWSPIEYPDVAKAINSEEFHWSELEGAGGYHKGIAFIVCAGKSMLQEARNSSKDLEFEKDDELALDILEDWLIDSSEANFERISSVLNDEKDEELVAHTSELVWWLLRSALAHPDGCGEIDWAFGSVYDGLVEKGFTYEELGRFGKMGVASRMRE